MTEATPAPKTALRLAGGREEALANPDRLRFGGPGVLPAPPSCLTSPELADVVARMRWFPGWTCSVLETEIGPALRVFSTQPDYLASGGETDLGINTHIPPMRDAAMFKAWLEWRLRLIAIHEHQEALQFDGVRYFNPHADYAWPEVHPTTEGST